MNSKSSIPLTFSVVDKFKTDIADLSFFSEDSLTFAGFNCELKDLLNKDDNAGSDCLDDVGAPANAAD